MQDQETVFRDGLADNGEIEIPFYEDRPRHIFQCLIIASDIQDGELVCEFKRATPVSDRAALDYWREENAPAGYLPPA